MLYMSLVRFCKIRVRWEWDVPNTTPPSQPKTNEPAPVFLRNLLPDWTNIIVKKNFGMGDLATSDASRVIQRLSRYYKKFLGFLQNSQKCTFYIPRSWVRYRLCQTFGNSCAISLWINSNLNGNVLADSQKSPSLQDKWLYPIVGSVWRISSSPHLA